MKDPRVLVVSNNCFSDNNSNGRTLGNFFINWDKKSLAQFYIQSEIPTSNVCENFYRLTDYEVLKSILEFRSYGRVIEKKEIIIDAKISRTDGEFEKKINSSKVRKKNYIYILRNLLWFTKKWKTDGFFKWIDDFNPEIIVFQAGDSAFMANIATELSIKYNIPIVIYNSEDHYLREKKSYSPMFNLKQIIFKTNFKKLMNQTKYVIYVCDLLKENFDKKIFSPSEALLTASNITPIENKKENEIPIISYLGNIGIERWKSIVEIGQILQKIDSNYFIDVYTQKLLPEAIDVFTESNGVRFKGSVSYAEVVKIMQNSDILLYTESFSESNQQYLKHAFSTKIADSLACGTCLFAYGPKEIASIKYLGENNVACVVTNQKELEQKLKELLLNKELRNQYIENALKLSKDRHDIGVNSKKFKEIICKVTKEDRRMKNENLTS